MKVKKIIRIVFWLLYLAFIGYTVHLVSYGYHHCGSTLGMCIGTVVLCMVFGLFVLGGIFTVLESNE